MNREIKFRGYGIAEKKWMYGYGLHEVIYRYENGETKATWLTTDIKNISMVHDKSAGEYTGLKDKNGEEIYEGDILMCDFYPCQGIYLVNWDKKDACFIAIDKKDGYVPAYVWDNCEIIGNIYENKELLEVE